MNFVNSRPASSGLLRGEFQEIVIPGIPVCAHCYLNWLKFQGNNFRIPECAHTLFLKFWP